MQKFRFQRHGRIQEAVAEELGIFRELGLAYEWAPHRPRGEHIAGYEELQENSIVREESAYRNFVLGSSVSNVASTSHWAVSVAVRFGYGEIWPKAYSIMPAGIYVGPETRIKSVDELRGREIIAGRHSGSHFAALYSLQGAGAAGGFELKFIEGRMKRLQYLLDHSDAIGSMYGVDSYILESQGYRKILDSSFIVSFMISGSPDRQDTGKYFTALQLAQQSIDENPGRFTHLLLEEFPDQFKDSLDSRPFGIGERIIFNPYSPEVLTRARRWVEEQKILPERWLQNSKGAVS